MSIIFIPTKYIILIIFYDKYYFFFLTQEAQEEKVTQKENNNSKLYNRLFLDNLPALNYTLEIPKLKNDNEGLIDFDTLPIKRSELENAIMGLKSGDLNE